ncbi:MAG: GNAT family N-acetyltransferase [Pseudomonadota bacterium]
MTDSGIHIRPGRLADETALLDLLPRLAEFELSPQRDPKDLWSSDAKLLSAVLRDEAPESFLLVAADAASDAPAGCALVTLQGEFMSGTPGAHLQAIAVMPGYEGRGIGRRLLDAIEHEARARGARSMTLHVFTANERAHRLYEAVGYESEVQRCIKWLDEETAHE